MDSSPRKPALPAIGGRLGMPAAILGCAVACVLFALGYVTLYAALRATDPAMAQAMLRLFGLTIAAGRETALFDAQRHGMPLGLSIVLSVVDDQMTLLFNIVLVWLLVHLLGRVGSARLLLARIETQALRHRRWVQRWGLGGLAVFYMLPGFGSGPAIAAAIGVLARIRAVRLAVVLGLGVAAVDVAWAVGVYFPAHAFPDVAWLDWIPLAMIGFLAALTLYGLYRDRHNRGVVLLDWDPRPTPQHEQAMAAWGVRLADSLVEARLPLVSAATGLPRKRALFASELLLLDGMTPGAARSLVEAKVLGLRDAAAVTDEQVEAALPAMQRDELRPLAQRWREQAAAMVEHSGSAWRQAQGGAA